MSDLSRNIFAYINDRAERHRPYWAALGEFIHAFSQVERELQELVFHLSGVSPTDGRALFYGLRIDAAKDAINRLLDARDDQATKARLEGPFAQLGHIANMRNNIIHWGASDLGNSDWFLVSNDFLAHTPAKLREFRVSVANLKEMNADLTKIGMHLSYEIHHRHVRSEMLERVAKPVLDAPWSYKPPQPSPPQSKPGTRASRRERQRQRASSPKTH
jgi:hypothetical protein